MTNALISSRDLFVKTHPETRITISGRDWGYIRVGETGPPLILIPGTLGRADVFWQQIAPLKNHARLLALSYPASGSIADWASDIAKMVTIFGLHNAVVLGSSLGGYLAQYLAANHGGLLGGLIAANTLPSVIGLDQMPPYKSDLAATPIEDLRAGFTAGLAQWVTPQHPYSDLAELLMLEVQGRIPEAELRARLNALKTGPKLPRVKLSASKVFTLDCGDDHLISPAWQQEVRDNLQPSRAYHLDGASHFPYVTRPIEYTAMLEEVLGLAPVGTLWPKGKRAIL
ncbi:MAG: maspardin [Paracoccaceae bacterium]|jgi:maspardin